MSRPTQGAGRVLLELLTLIRTACESPVAPALSVARATSDYRAEMDLIGQFDLAQS